MKGTEKQIKWAQDIMRGAFAALADMEQAAQDTTVNYQAEDVKAIRGELETLFADPRVTASMIIDIRGRVSRQQLEAQAINRRNARQ